MANQPKISLRIEALDAYSTVLENAVDASARMGAEWQKMGGAVSKTGKQVMDETAQIQAAYNKQAVDARKAAEARAAAARKAAEDVAAANRNIEKLGGKTSTDRLSGSFETLNIKSALDIEREKARAIAAFEAIKKSGVASADEIKRAQTALKERLDSIDGAVSGLGAKLKTGLAGVAEMLAGVFAIERIVAFVRASFDASLAVDNITGKFKVLTGSSEGAAKEWQFVRNEAKRLGLDLRETSDSYSNFLSAVKGTANEGAGARKIFVGINEGMAAIGMSAEAQGRAWAQLNQGIMKGKFEMEDLKTINEAGLPIFKLLADSLGVTTAEFLKMQQEGKVLVGDVLPKLGDAMHNGFGKAAEEAATRSRAAMNRLKTELFELMAQVGTSAGPGILWFGQRIMNITKAVVGGWQLIAVQVGYTIDYIKARMDLTLSKQATRKRLAEIGQAYREQVAEIAKNYGESQAAITGAEEQSTRQSEANSQRRRDNARKTGSDLAKINVEYAKMTGDAEAQLTADLQKQFEERKKAATDYYDQKKAAAKDDGEEAAWESIKKAKLLEIERQHARDVEIVQAQSQAAKLNGIKDQLAMEALLIQEKVANGVMTESQGQQRITELTVAAARMQYEAKKAVTDKIIEIYGKDGEEYKKALKEQESAHKEYLSSNLSAYKTYSDNIKKLDQEIADFRLSIQQKIADLQQRGMTEGEKYADNQKRFDEAVSKSKEALARKDYETAQKYAKQAEELASRLADKKAEQNSKLQDLEKQHQERLADIARQNTGKQSDQQRQQSEMERENAEYAKRRKDILAEQQATTEGITNATRALNQVEELGVSIMEAKKQENQDALAKLKEIQAMKLDPKNLAVNMDEGALGAVRQQIAALTKDETKTIYIRTVEKRAHGGQVGMSRGGKLPGDSLIDSIPVLARPGEWFIRNESAKFWGDGFMAAINAPLSAAGQRLQAAMGMQKFSTGGQVQPSDMGSITINVGAASFPVQGKQNMLAGLKQELRREQLRRPQ